MELIWLHAEDAPSPRHLALSCRHCADPTCLAVCPGDAIAKTEDGTVTVQEENCLGCRACADACPFDVPRFNAEDAPSPRHLTLSCRHCADPACLAVCPGDAIAKTEDGTVTVQEENCLGCRACADACPFDVPRFNEDSGVMEKCDLCRGLPVEGIAPPCAATCPTGALRLELVEREEKREAEQSLLTLLKERRGQSFPKEY